MILANVPSEGINRGNVLKKSVPTPAESNASGDVPMNPFAGLDSPRKADRGSSQQKQQLPKVPVALTKRVMKKISDLDRSLRVQGRISEWSHIPSWQTVLNHYRDSVAGGITNPWFVRKYDLLCLASAKALHEAFQDVHEYDPVEYLTQGAKAAVGRHNKLGKRHAERVKAKRMLRESGYLDAPNARRGEPDTPGSKAAIRANIRNKTDVSESVLYELVQELKDEG